jgi:ADP-heptose:LPS heptosyltransferase
MQSYVKAISTKRKIYNSLLFVLKPLLLLFSIKSRKTKVTPQKFLYICLAERGDIIMSSASINYIKEKHPDSIIYYVCKIEYEKIANLINNIDFVIPIKTNFRDFLLNFKIIFLHRKTKIDIVFDETGSILTTFLWRIINPRNAFMVNQHGISFLSSKFIDYSEQQNILDRRRSLLELYFGNINKHFFIPKIIINNNFDILNRYLVFEKKYVTFQPHGGWAEKSIGNELVKSLIEKIYLHFAKTIVFLGSEQDFKKIEEVVNNINNINCINLAGKLSISNSVIFVKNAFIHIGVDSFLRHISIAVGTPSISIFGPTSHLLSGYIDEMHIPIYSDLECRPFNNQYCKFDAGRTCSHLDCMKKISNDKININFTEFKKIVGTKYL